MTLNIDVQQITGDRALQELCYYDAGLCLARLLH